MSTAAPAPDEEPVVRLEGVSFGYTATPVVDAVDLRVDAGE